MKNKKRLLEVACFSVDSAITAQQAGADRIELCRDYDSGGLTPTTQEIRLAKDALRIPLFVMIRPTAITFSYSEKDFEQMKTEIRLCKEMKCEGVVFGILTHDGAIDEKRCIELCQLAKPMHTTFHRAFDQTPDAKDALETLIRCGFTRVLTSGHTKNAETGMDKLSNLNRAADERIIILAGGGIRSSNIALIATRCRGEEFHSSGIITPGLGADYAEISEMKSILSRI